MPPFIQQHRNICPQLHNIAVFGLDASADQFQHGARPVCLRAHRFLLSGAVTPKP